MPKKTWAGKKKQEEYNMEKQKKKAFGWNAFQKYTWIQRQVRSFMQ